MLQRPDSISTPFFPKKIIETQASRSTRKKEETTSEHAHILHEHDHLDAIAEIGMKDECGWNEKDEDEKGSKSCEISQDDAEASDQFKNDGAEEEERGKRHPKLCHILSRPLKVSNLPDSGIEKDKDEKNSSDQTAEGF
jgi:hypothetical protein